MSLVEINWSPARKELRSFGKIALGASVIICLLLYIFKSTPVLWLLLIFAAGVIIFLASLISLKLTRLFYLGLVLATMPIGLAVSVLVMAMFYFLLLTPLGLVFRLLGRDPLERKFKSKRQSYWQKHRSPDSIERYFRQF
jgi:hypothetical protein